MSFIWLLILVASLITMLFINPSGAITAMLSGATGAVELAMQLVAMYGFWLGFFAILEKTGIADMIAKLLRPLIRFLFKGTDDKTQKFISMNMSANLLGLGNASTPMGINAINSMNKGSKKATTNMIMLVVISATSLQLLPSTVIGMRASHGSSNPSDFLIPCIVSTILSTVIGIVLVKIISRFLPDEDALAAGKKGKKTRKGRKGKMRAAKAEAASITQTQIEPAPLPAAAHMKNLSIGSGGGLPLIKPGKGGAR